jgi:hypothetical protein
MRLKSGAAMQTILGANGVIGRALSRELPRTEKLMARERVSDGHRQSSK